MWVQYVMYLCPLSRPFSFSLEAPLIYVGQANILTPADTNCLVLSFIFSTTSNRSNGHFSLHFRVSFFQRTTSRNRCCCVSSGNGPETRLSKCTSVLMCASVYAKWMDHRIVCMHLFCFHNVPNVKSSVLMSPYIFNEQHDDIVHLFFFSFPSAMIEKKTWTFN